MSDAVKTSSSKLPLVVGAVVVVAVVATIILLGGRHSEAPSGESTSTKEGHVKIEFRAMPPSTITLDGVKIGKTPLTVTVPKKSTAVTAVATSKVTRYYANRKKVVLEVAQTQQVTPDRDQTVDFKKLVPVPGQTVPGQQPLPDEPGQTTIPPEK